VPAEAGSPQPTVNTRLTTDPAANARSRVIFPPSRTALSIPNGMIAREDNGGKHASEVSGRLPVLGCLLSLACARKAFVAARAAGGVRVVMSVAASLPPPAGVLCGRWRRSQPLPTAVTGAPLQPDACHRSRRDAGGIGHSHPVLASNRVAGPWRGRFR
jgi:hypothetical protein